MTIDETITVTEEDIRGTVRSVGRPRGFVVFVVIAALTAVLTVVTSVLGDAVFAVIFGTLAALLLGGALLLRVIVGRSVRAGLPAGSSLRLRADERGITTVSALGSSEFRYAAVRRVERRGAAIMLRLISGGVGVLPGRLLDDAQLATLRDLVEPG